MKLKSWGMICILSWAATLLPACSASPNQDLSRLLPESTMAGAWKPEGDPGSWEGEDLYIYINGGAEIFHEYGFQRVIIQDYKNQEDSSISLEIYEMQDAGGAYGIFSFQASDTGEKLDIGQGGQFEDYYLNFWQDRFFITLTGFDQKPQTLAGLKHLAEALAARFGKREHGIPPALLNRLPRENLLPTGMKYFRGHLGLFNSYPFSQQDIFQLQEAAKGRYAGGHEIYLIPYKDVATRQDIFLSVKDALFSSSDYHGAVSSGNGFLLYDKDNILIRVEPIGTDIVIVTRCADPAAAAIVIDAFIKRLNTA